MVVVVAVDRILVDVDDLVVVREGIVCNVDVVGVVVVDGVIVVSDGVTVVGDAVVDGIVFTDVAVV